MFLLENCCSWVSINGKVGLGARMNKVSFNRNTNPLKYPEFCIIIFLLLGAVHSYTLFLQSTLSAGVHSNILAVP